MADGLSDKGIAVFAFAAYHQLTSGEAVSQVTRADGKGHTADPQAVQDVTDAGLATADEQWITFTDKGLAKLASVVEALRKA